MTIVGYVSEEFCGSSSFDGFYLPFSANEMHGVVAPEEAVHLLKNLQTFATGSNTQETREVTVIHFYNLSF